LRSPKGLRVSYKGDEIAYRWGPVAPFDSVAGREMANKGFPGLREFVVFDIEIGNDRVSMKPWANGR
jgi:hypothetical protein